MYAKIVFSYQLESSGNLLLTAAEMHTVVHTAVLCQIGFSSCVNPVLNVRIIIV